MQEDQIIDIEIFEVAAASGYRPRRYDSYFKTWFSAFWVDNIRYKAVSSTRSKTLSPLHVYTKVVPANVPG